MAAYVDGDQRSFALLVQRWAPRLHGFFLCALREPAAAEDLLQQTFLHVHRARRSFQPPCHLRGWFFGIAHHALQDELRRRKRAPLASEEEQEAVALEAVADAPEPIELQESTVRAALDRLPIRSAPFCTFTVSKR